MLMPKTCNKCKTDNEVRNNYCYKCGEELASDEIKVPGGNRSITWTFDLDLSTIPSLNLGNVVNTLKDLGVDMDAELEKQGVKLEEEEEESDETTSYRRTTSEKGLTITCEKFQDGVFNVYATDLKKKVIAYYATDHEESATNIADALQNCFKYPDPVRAAMAFTIRESNLHVSRSTTIIYERGVYQD